MVTSTESPLLEAHEVTKCFERRDGSSFNAVDRVSLSISASETVALVGETGSGKSTLARLALGLSTPDEGDICFRGKPLERMSSAERHKFRLAVQPIFQDPGASFNPRKKVQDLLRQAFVQAGRSRDAIPAATSAVLASVGLHATPDFLQRYPHELSGGQKQRLAIARALVQRPEIYLLDDSFSALDFKTDARLRAALKRETADATLLVVAQRVATVMDADRIIVLDEGRLVGIGRHRELLATCAVYREIVSSQLSAEEIA
jgi:ATP-binding cassette, subfamily B, multidrug efflux pump